MSGYLLYLSNLKHVSALAESATEWASITKSTIRLLCLLNAWHMEASARGPTQV